MVKSCTIFRVCQNLCPIGWDRYKFSLDMKTFDMTTILLIREKKAETFENSLQITVELKFIL